MLPHPKRLPEIIKVSNAKKLYPLDILVLYIISIISTFLDLSNIYSQPQRTIKVKKRAAAPSSLEKSLLNFDPSISQLDRTRIASPAPKSRSPISGRGFQYHLDKPLSRPQSRPRDGSAREITEKYVSLSHVQNPRHSRGGSNPRPVVNMNDSYCSNSRPVMNESYYYSMPKNVQPNSRKENQPELESDLKRESSKPQHPKQAWPLNNDSGELSLISLLQKKPPSSRSKKDQNLFREKKMSYMSNQPGESVSCLSKVEDGKLRLKDFSRYLDAEELKVGASLGKDFHKLELSFKKENIVRKLVLDKSQELKNSSHFKIPPSRGSFVEQKIENKEHMKQTNEIPDEDRRMGTEEFYEDFFSTKKLSFDFEKARVSQREISQREASQREASQRDVKKKEHFTPETTPSGASNPLRKYFSNRESPINIVRRPSEGKSVRARHIE